jgi:hypothetical protein
MGRPRKSDPTKYCMRCGVQLERQKTGDRLEDRGVFLRRKYCSLTCANSRTTVTRGGHYWRARKFRGPSCEACGTRKSLQVHHVNGDHRDNRPENAQTLCIHCHKFWHDTLSRHGRSIDGRMPPLF